MLTIRALFGTIADMTSRLSGRADEATQRGLVDAWLNSQSSPNTMSAYKTDMATFGMWCASQGAIALFADAATLAAFQRARDAAGDSPATMRRRWSSLSSFYEFAVSNQAASSNPVVGVARPKVRAGDPSPTAELSASAVEEYRALAASLDLRLEVLVGLLVYDGLKLGEALALDVGQVSGRHPKITITIRRRGETKRVTLHPDSARAVSRCVGSRRHGPLLTSERSSATSGSGRLTRFGADHLIRQLSAGSQNRVTASELRRFHITASHDDDTDLDDVRERAGLAHVRSVRRYLAPTD